MGFDFAPPPLHHCSSVAVLPIVYSVYAVTYFNPHFYPGQHLCVCDGVMAMSVCNGLFFITFSLSHTSLTIMHKIHFSNSITMGKVYCVSFIIETVGWNVRFKISSSSHELFLQNLCGVSFWLCSVFYSFSYQFIASKIYI